MFDDVLIMAGGSGTRLWPASNSRLPKQFLSAGKEKSFFDMALERAIAVTKKNGRVIIITSKQHIPLVIACGRKLIPADKKRLLVLGEPAAKNTAPAVACAVKLSILAGYNRNMFVLTSDHIIKPLSIFKADSALAAKTPGLTVFGIPPAFPDTGYGYIETAEKLKDGVFKAAAFHEKPDAKTAEKYVSNGNFFWNSGMFAFGSEFIAEQFNKLAPLVFSPFLKLKAPKPQDYSITHGIKILKSWSGLENAYKKTQGISFDYAIAEKCSQTNMIKAKFDWIDIGNWEEYAKISKNNGINVFYIPEDGKSINTNHVDSDIPVALAGVDDLIIVIRSGKNGQPASALITKKGQTQKVKDAVELIKKTGKKELL